MEGMNMDSLAIGSLIISGIAVMIAVLTWLESRKMRQLFEKVAKALPHVGRSRRGPGTKPSAGATQEAIEERRRLKLDLDRQKHEWRKNRDIAKVLAWMLERMNNDE